MVSVTRIPSDSQMKFEIFLYYFLSTYFYHLVELNFNVVINVKTNDPQNSV